MEPRSIILVFVASVFFLGSGAGGADLGDDVEWDVILIGGGVAGCIAAERFSSFGLNTLLLESGPPAQAAFGGTDVPSEWNGVAEANHRNLTRFDVPGEYGNIAWNPRSEEYRQPRQPWAWLPNVLGGGGAVNGALTMRMHPYSFDVLNGTGWDYEALLPHVEAVLSDLPPTETPSADKEHYLEPTADVFRKALEAMNFTHKHLNSPGSRSNTYTYPEVIVHRGQRTNTCLRYLPKALKRRNFRLMTDAGALQIVQSAGVAAGVAFVHHGSEQPIAKLSSTGRVVLTAGALNTPRLLMLSGVGPKAELEKLDMYKRAPPRGSWVVSEGVGLHLADHVYLRMRFALPGYAPFNYRERPKSAVHRYFANFTGPFAQYGPVLLGYMVSPWATPPDQPDIETYIEAFDNPPDPAEARKNAFNIYMALLRPRSKGSLELKVTEPAHFVESWPKSYADLYLKDSADIGAFRWGVEQIVDAMQKAHGQSLELVVPKEASASAYDDLVKDWRESHMLANHFSSTCTFHTGCADPHTLLVKGTSNIHVADASLLPSPMAGHPWLSVAAFARKAADSIKGLVRPAGPTVYV